MKTAGQAARQRPWEVGLCKTLQKPRETLSQYIKDTVCSSSLLLFLLPSSASLSPDCSLFIFLRRLSSSSSTHLLSVSSFTLLFRCGFFFFFYCSLTIHYHQYGLKSKAFHTGQHWVRGSVALNCVTELNKHCLFDLKL